MRENQATIGTNCKFRTPCQSREEEEEEEKEEIKEREREREPAVEEE